MRGRRVVCIVKCKRGTKRRYESVNRLLQPLRKKQKSW